MTDTALTLARRLLDRAADAVSAIAGSGGDDELIAVLALCEGATRRLDRVAVDAVAALERRGVFAERGYRSTAGALGDLLGWERFEARRRVVAAEQVTPRVGLDGAALPARLPGTAGVFAAGRASLRHVEMIAKVLRSPAAERLSPEQWAGAEAALAEKAEAYTPWAGRPERSPTGSAEPWPPAMTGVRIQDAIEPSRGRLVVRRAPHSGVGVRWRDETIEPGDVVPRSPPTNPFHGKDCAHPRRAARVRAPEMDRSHADAAAQSPAVPRGPP